MRAVGLLFAVLLLAGCAATQPGRAASGTPGRTISPAGTGGPVPATTGPDRPESPAPMLTPPSPPAGSGVTGVTLVAGNCPVSRVDPACADKPVPARLTVVDSHSGATVATVTTGADGVFRIPLPPGTYELRPANVPGGTLRRPEPATVVVTAGRYAIANVRFDTGIR
jgi:hypothetical protein